MRRGCTAVELRGFGDLMRADVRSGDRRSEVTPATQRSHCVRNAVAPSGGRRGVGARGYDSYIWSGLRSRGAEPQGVEVVALDLVDSAEHRVEVVRDANVAAGQPIGATGGKRLDQSGGLVRIGAVPRS